MIKEKLFIINLSERYKKFGDEKSMGSSEMGKIISSTHFIPCPNGFFHPETYRLYEALECECIPIVENAYKYYDRLFPDNPFLKINKDRKNYRYACRILKKMIKLGGKDKVEQIMEYLRNEYSNRRALMEELHQV